MSDGRPVRVTFPSYDEGMADILADGMRSGIVLAENTGWRAYLYPALTGRRVRAGDEEEVTGRTLGELRRMLRERVELKGPWWALPSPSAAEARPRDGAGTSG